MKKITMAIITIYLSGLQAAGFHFLTQKEFMSEDIQFLLAKTKFNGTEYSCLVDTGARFSMFKESFIKDLPKVGQTSGGGLSNINQVTDLVSGDLILGDWQIAPAIVGRPQAIPFDCLIGNDFFLKKNFKIDFGISQFSDLETPLDLKGSYPLHVYPSESGGHFGFDLIMAQKKVETIFDTGAAGTVVSLLFVGENPQHFKFIKEIPVTDGNSAELKAGIYELDELSFSGTTVKGLQIYALDLKNLNTKLPNVEVVLGLDLIQHYDWQFDMKNQAFTYEAR